MCINLPYKYYLVNILLTLYILTLCSLTRDLYRIDNKITHYYVRTGYFNVQSDYKMYCQIIGRLSFIALLLP